MSLANTVARCLYLALQDGTTLGFIDHDVDLVIDMPDVFDMAVTYRRIWGSCRATSH